MNVGSIIQKLQLLLPQVGPGPPSLHWPLCLPRTKRAAVQHHIWAPPHWIMMQPFLYNPQPVCPIFAHAIQTFPVSCSESKKQKREFASLSLVVFLEMEKSKSFPEYCCAYTEFGVSERSNSYNFNGPSQKGNGFCGANDPELKRKKRIKAYNVFTEEGKIKTSVRNSFKWIKNKFSDIRYGV